MHEVEATFLPPVRLSSQLAETILSTGEEVEADLVLLPAPGRGSGAAGHADLTDTILAIVQRWPRAILTAS